MKLLLGLATIFFLNTALAYPLIPDLESSPGSLCTRNHDDYSEDRYAEKIPYCERNVSSAQKKEIYDLYEIPTKCRSRYTIDHIIPLALGGDNSPENLWPEHKLVKATRPDLEIKLFTALKNGKMKQKEAVRIILKNKFTAPEVQNGKSNCDKLNHLK